jgi:hypothetical protein
MLFMSDNEGEGSHSPNGANLAVASVAEGNEQATGASLVAAMQACPIKEIDIEPERYPMPVRNVSF